MPNLAIAGGNPIRRRPFPRWPQFDNREREALVQVLESRNWGGYPFPNALAELFAGRFARAQVRNFELRSANGE